MLAAVIVGEEGGGGLRGGGNGGSLLLKRVQFVEGAGLHRQRAVVVADLVVLLCMNLGQAIAPVRRHFL